MATGSLQVSRGRYVAMIRYKEGEKTRQVSRSLNLPAIKGNKRNANERLLELIQEFNEKEKHDVECNLNQNKRVKFTDYIGYWLEQKEAYVSPTTFQSYKIIVHDNILPYFEPLALFLDEVTGPILQTYFDKMIRSGKNGERLSSKTVKRYKTIINQVLTHARRMGLINTDPCEFITLPPCEDKNISYYSAQEIKTLFDALKGDTLEDLVYVTAVYGLRRSEVLGLKWDSVDFDNETVTIKHTVTKVSRVVEKDKTKNKSSYRTYPLLPKVKDIFIRLKGSEKKNSRLFRKEYHKNDYIFKWPDGKPFAPDYVSQHFAAVIKHKGLKYITFHGLRHSCASVLVNQGMTPKDIQEWLGHSDVRTTMNIYGHIDASRKKVIGETIANTVS